MTRALIIVDVAERLLRGRVAASRPAGPRWPPVCRRLWPTRPATGRTSWRPRISTSIPGAHFGDPPDYVDSWPVHCVAGTSGSDFHPALDTDRIEAVFVKGEHAAAYSGFEGHAGSISLAAWLRMHDVTEVDVVGIATDHCVRATALDAVAEGFATTVLLDLTAGIARSTTDAALAAMTDAGVSLVGEPVVRA